MMIEVKDLRKTYKTHKRKPGIANAFKSIINRKYEIKHAVDGVSFKVEKGEIVGLIGPNGAGKSTTIKAMSGVLYPTSGDVKIMGYVPWKQRIEYVKRIGVVFGQKPQLYWDVPPTETFLLNKRLYDIPEKAYKTRLNYMIKLLQMENIYDTPVRDMSLGERMKCNVISALLHRPDLVFLDEPSIGLDIIAKDRLREFILDVNKKYGTTFIVTTHDMQDIERLCKRIIIINHGVIVYDGLLSKIRDKVLGSKVIDVKFNDWNKKFSFKGCKIMEKTDFELKIEVNLKVTTLRKVIDHLVTHYDFADLLVTDPPIEKIIQRLYEK